MSSTLNVFLRSRRLGSYTDAKRPCGCLSAVRQNETYLGMACSDHVRISDPFPFWLGLCRTSRIKHDKKTEHIKKFAHQQEYNK
jgi:hypothetical protein